MMTTFLRRSAWLLLMLGGLASWAIATGALGGPRPPLLEQLPAQLGTLQRAAIHDVDPGLLAACRPEGQDFSLLIDRGFIPEAVSARPRVIDSTLPLVLVGVVLDRSTPQSFAAFEQAASGLPFILDCHLVAGDFDYFLKIRIRDIADFNRLHGEQLIALPGVRQTRTFFVMKEVVDGAPLDF